MCSLQPDVLTLDPCMSNRDGIEILSHLKALGFKGQIIISEPDDWLRKQTRDLARARGLNVADEMGNPSTLTRCEARSRDWRARA